MLYDHVASLLCRHSEIHAINLIEMLCVCLISLISSGPLHLVIVRLQVYMIILVSQGLIYESISFLNRKFKQGI